MSLVRVDRATLDACLDDLARVTEDVRWAYQTGYGKQGRGLDAERGAPLPPQEDEANPDTVKGERYELDVGDHACRDAYQRTAARLAKVEVHLAVACDAAGLTAQPILVKPSPQSEAVRVLACASGIRWRLIALREVEVSTIQRRRIRHHTEQARKMLDVSVRQLGKALSKGKASEAVGEKPCITCEIRPRRDRGKECDTCHTWRRRNNTTRPKKLDEAVVESAQAAKRRREERGEGWGAA